MSLTRRTPLKNKTSMKRSSTPMMRAAQIRTTPMPSLRAAIKARKKGKKKPKTVYGNPALLALAEGEECLTRVPTYCWGGTESTVIWLSTNGYSISGGITVANFKLENVGHRARDVIVECLLSNRQIPTKIYPMLKKDSVVELAIEGLRRDDIGTVRFVITLVDGAGEKAITEFPEVVEPVASNGVQVVLSQPFERADG